MNVHNVIVHSNVTANAGCAATRAQGVWICRHDAWRFLLPDGTDATPYVVVRGNAFVASPQKAVSQDF
jgi:hypothetical protein